MGRMYRLMTEAASVARPTRPMPPDASQLTADELERGTPPAMNTIVHETIPFVEVGGPEGVVTSYTRTVHSVPTTHTQTRVVSVPSPTPLHAVPAPTTHTQTRVVSVPTPAPAPRVLNLPEPVRLAPTTTSETVRVVHTPGYFETRENYATPASAAPVSPLSQLTPLSTVADTRKLSVSLHKFAKPGLRILPSEIAPEVVTYHHPEHPVSSEYRLLRDEIRRTLEPGVSKIVSLTSVGHASGTTTVLLNVAVAMTQDPSSRVLVIDANLSRPSVATRLGVTEVPGLVEVAAQAVPLAWAVQNTAIPGLHVLSAGTITDNAMAKTLHELPRLVQQVKAWFDVVLVDAGLWDQLVPVRHGYVQPATAAQPTSLAHASDSIYLVTRHTDLERIDMSQLRQVLGHGLKGYITTRG